ncbi:TetR/AcrR family transcriptional regulator [Nocardia takedensis]
MGPRDRLVESTIELVREQGVHGAGLTALLDRSRTSRNSLYQHFPAGKGELVEAATQIAGARLTRFLAKVVATGKPRDWLAAMTGWARALVEPSDYRAGCPVLGAALAESEPAVQAAAGAAFADWTALLTTALRERGVDHERAEALAGTLISAIEGAIAQARALKTSRPLDDVESVFAPLLDAIGPA